EKDGKMVAEVINASCKGCGACLPVCPEDAIELLGYTNSEIEAMIDAIAAEIEVSEKDSETKISAEKETEVEDDWLVKVEKLDENGKRILEALESKQKSIPEIVEETKIPAPEVTYRLMSLRKYGYVKDTNEINEDEYYEYALNH
ncbi:MAG: 4Fe-4S binding protein, partial [Cyclobacteriaceae bacterium]|nr:4Fe-4S binding protein [Cyclobacteriaceae bacterium]